MDRTVPLPCALAALGLTGCVPLAWATPPARVDAALGGGPQRTRVDGNTTSWQPVGTYEIRGAFTPLQLLPDADQRRLDFGMGYGLRGNFERWQGPVHGPYAELSWLTALPERRADRLTLGAQLHALDDSRGSYAFAGGRVGARAALEWAGRPDGEFSDCDSSTDAIVCTSGRAHGEAGFGVYLEGSYQRVRAREEVIVTAGLTLRMPATFGVGFVLFNPVSLLTSAL